MSTKMFITGGTGNQGGGVIKALARQGDNITIHALVRKPESDAAKALTALGSNVKLFPGDFDDIPAIRTAAEGCTAAFITVSPDFQDPSAEARHAQNLVSVCAGTSSMERVVYSSSGAMHQPADTKVWTEYVEKKPDSFMSGHMKSKKACEDAVTSTSSMDFREGWSIVRASTFFTNYIHPSSQFMYPELATKQTITTPIRLELLQSHFDHSDLAVFLANMLITDHIEWYKNFKSKYIPFGTQNLSFNDLVDAMNKGLKNAGSQKQVKINFVPESEEAQRMAANDIAFGAQTFLNEYPAEYDMDEVKSFGVDVDHAVTLEAFFEREKEALLKTVGGL